MTARRQFLWAIFGVGLVLRVAVIFWLNNFETANGYECGTISRNLLAGRGFSMSVWGSPIVPTAHHYPLYCWLMAANFWAFGFHYMPVELCQALLGGLVPVMLFLLCERLFSKRSDVSMIAGLSAALCALYPVYVYWAARPQALTLDIFLLVLLLWRFDVAAAERNWRPWVIVGLCLGVAGLSKSLYLALVPVLFGWGWLRYRQVRLRHVAMVGLVSLLVITPWTVRNIVSLGSFVLVSSNSGYNLWAGNNPRATGGVFGAEREAVKPTDDPALVQAMAGLNDVGRDRVLRAAAMDYIRSDLPRFFAMVPKRLAALWWFDDYVPSDYDTARKLTYLCLFALALPGMWLGRRHFRALSIFYACFVVISVIYSGFYGSARFRYAFEFGLLVFAALGLNALWQRARVVRVTPGNSHSTRL